MVSRMASRSTLRVKSRARRSWLEIWSSMWLSTLTSLAERVVHHHLLALVDEVVGIRPLLPMTRSYRLVKIPFVAAVDQDAVHQVGEVVADGAVHRPLRQVLAALQDLLHQQIERRATWLGLPRSAKAACTSSSIPLSRRGTRGLRSAARLAAYSICRRAKYCTGFSSPSG